MVWALVLTVLTGCVSKPIRVRSTASLGAVPMPVSGRLKGLFDAFPAITRCAGRASAARGWKPTSIVQLSPVGRGRPMQVSRVIR